jgi:hypothetical protein
MRTMRIFAAFSLMVTGVTVATAAESNIKGNMFGDYYYAVSGPDEKRNAFQFRRIYLTHDVKWDDSFSGRLRFEAKDAGFGNGGTMDPSVKDAYLRYRWGSRSLYAGQSPSPSWSITEKLWGYRAVEKTIMDLQKVGSSRDNGIGFKTPLGGSEKINLHLMVGNGNSTKSETDHDKKLYGLVEFKPAGALVATAYVDWQSQPQDRDQTTLAVVVGKAGEDLHGAVEVFSHTAANAAGGKDVTTQGVSLFGAKRLRDNVKVFARADLADPNTDADDDSEMLLMGGIDWSPTKGIHIMPNLQVISEDTPGVDTAVIPRVTGYFKF